MAYKAGIGHHLDDDERTRFIVAQAGLVNALCENALTGTKQNALAELIESVKPAFSEGELRHAIRQALDSSL